MATPKNNKRSTEARAGAPTEARSVGPSADASNSESTSLFARTGRTIKQQPYASAAIATGVVTAGAMFFARRGQSDSDNGETMTAKVKGSFAEARARIKEFVSSDASLQQGDGRSQREIAEEALTLKETGGSNAASAATSASTGSTLDDSSKSEIKTGAIAY